MGTKPRIFRAGLVSREKNPRFCHLGSNKKCFEIYYFKTTTVKALIIRLVQENEIHSRNQDRYDSGLQ